MGLGQLSRGAIPLGAPPGPCLHWQPSLYEPMVERPARRVHGRRVAQGRSGLRLDVWKTKLLRCPRALGVVTGFAGDGQVRDAIRAIADLGDDVLDLQGDVVALQYAHFRPNFSSRYSLIS